MNRKKRMSRKKLTLASLVAIPVVAGLAFAITGSAFAGTNGQQIQLCQDFKDTDYRNAFVEGKNQNDQQQQKEVRLVNGCITLEGLWWKGAVDIEWSSPISSGLRSRFSTPCEVPVVLEQDTFKCPSPQPPPPGVILLP